MLHITFSICGKIIKRKTEEHGHEKNCQIVPFSSQQLFGCEKFQNKPFIISSGTVMSEEKIKVEPILLLRYKLSEKVLQLEPFVSQDATTWLG